MNEAFGTEAEEYAAGHLVRGEANTESLTEQYSCPDTGRRFELDWPERNDREPGQARLRMVEAS